MSDRRTDARRDRGAGGRGARGPARPRTPRRSPGRLAAVLVGVLAALLVAPAGAQAAPRTVGGELARLQSADRITAAQRSGWRADYLAATRRVSALSGTPRRELAGVVAEARDIARRGRLDEHVAPSLFETLTVNTAWWGRRTTPPVGGRPTVPGSPLVWQRYAGKGLQIQWLATFGLANALNGTATPAKAEQQRAILDAALRLASRRAGGPAWEYLFAFGGGDARWASAMAQSTAMQALLRGAERFDAPRYRASALDAVALLRRRPTSGTALRGAVGEHQLIYTFSRMRVLNAFAQVVSATREVAGRTGDGKVTGVYVRAERELRRELPAYDTGRWTRYALGGRDATREYHLLARDLVRGLCRGLAEDAGRRADGQPVLGGRPAPPEPYCDAADRWTDYARASSRSLGAPTPTPAPAADPAARLADPALAGP